MNPIHSRAASSAMARGFTIIELLVVITIIVLLISMLLPSLNSARDLVYQTQCMSNERQLQTGFQVYLDGNRQNIPIVEQAGWHRAVWGVADNNTSVNDAFSDVVPIDNNLYPVHPVKADFRVCPKIRTQFYPFFLAFPLAYVANPNWKAGQETETNPGLSCENVWQNTHRRWDNLLHPSTYPWLSDPGIYFIAAPGYNVYCFYPEIVNNYGSNPYWHSAGAYHLKEGGDADNMSFADGHVATVKATDYQGNSTGDVTYFQNR